MRVVGILAIIAGLLLVVQEMSPFSETDLVFLPILLGFTCFMTAVIWGLANGTAAVRATVVLGILSFVLFTFAITFVTIGGPVPGDLRGPSLNDIALVLSGVVLLFAVIQGVRAYRTEAAAVAGARHKTASRP